MFGMKNKAAKWTLAALIGVSAIVGTASPSHAGAQFQPRVAAEVAPARTTMIYNISFCRGEPAVVAVSGDGDTTLRVFVYDEDGNLIATGNDDSRSGVATVRWTPRWTGTFTIRVRNDGPVANRYVMRTN